jgi:hypothetical protein
VVPTALHVAAHILVPHILLAPLIYPSVPQTLSSSPALASFNNLLSRSTLNMKFFQRNASKQEAATEKGTPEGSTPAQSTPAQTPHRQDSTVLPNPVELQPEGRIPLIAIVLGAVASIGGFMFGYESGQISGFLEMSDFKTRFGENGVFSPVRQGTIVGLLA